jgi:signal recognition particle subunit SRP54
VFATLSDRLQATFKGLRGKGRLSEDDVDATVREIRIALLEADVALPVVRQFCAVIKERALGVEVSGALNPAQQVVKIVHEELVAILGGQVRRLRFAKVAPTVILLAGLQGAGKTTLAGKLAVHLRGMDRTPLLVAADLQRPNAVDQLQVVGQRAGVSVFAPEPGNGVGDPVAVARAGVEHGRTTGADIVIVDTAGRLAIDSDLMTQLRDVRDAVNPHEVLLVLDAMTGQDAVNTAAVFNESIGIDGVVLTKLDGDARGGAALSVVGVTAKPVLFASVGEKLEEFEAFHPDRMASRILDMGDVMTLIEQAERAFDADQQRRMADKVAKGEDFTLEDFLEQMQAMTRMGSVSKLMAMLPGMGQMREQLEAIDDREVTRIGAIIQSMTPAERRDPKILDGSRRSRIARGSGTQVSEVNNLVNRFSEAAKLMKRMRSGGGLPSMPGMPAMPGAPGLPGIPGVGRPGKAKAAKPGKGKQRSGNPAKRAAEERKALEERTREDLAPVEEPTGMPDFSRFLRG